MSFFISIVLSSCATGVVTNVIGAAVMQRADYLGYNVATAAQVGAVGGAILTPITGILSYPAFSEEDFPSIVSPVCFALGMGLVAAFGAVGSAVLEASGHSVQAVRQSAISGLVGSSTLIGACIALALVGWVVALLVGGTVGIALTRKEAVPLEEHRQNGEAV